MARKRNTDHDSAVTAALDLFWCQGYGASTREIESKTGLTRFTLQTAYGGKEGFYLSTVKRKYNLGKNAEERPLMSRTSLHAKKLVLSHPETNERMTFESELPKDFSAVLKQLRKWGK